MIFRKYTFQMSRLVQTFAEANQMTPTLIIGIDTVISLDKSDGNYGHGTRVREFGAQTNKMGSVPDKVFSRSLS